MLCSDQQGEAFRALDEEMETGLRCEELERVIFGEDGEKYFLIGK